MKYFSRSRGFFLLANLAWEKSVTKAILHKHLGFYVFICYAHKIYRQNFHIFRDGNFMDG